MATCEKIKPAPVPPPATYKLTLTESEARYLRTLLGGHVLGPYPGPRSLNTSICAALYEQGVQTMTMKVDTCVRWGCLSVSYE